MQRASVPPEVPALVVPPGETLPEILDRIRAAPGPMVLVDGSNHRLLRDQGHVRQLLVAATADLGKELVVLTNASAPVRVPKGSAPPERDDPRVLPKLTRPWHAVRHPVPEALRAPPTDVALGPAARVRWRLPLILFAFLAGGLLTGVVLFVLPRASVTLTTVVEPLATDLTVELAVGQAAEEGAFHPARHVVLEETFEGEFPVETIVETGERARGVVALVNRTDAPQGIKAGTRLESSEGVIVRTERDVIIPPQSKAPAAVRAASGGTAGNLAPQRLTLPALPAASQRVLFAEVTEPLRGGTDRPARQLALADIERATEALKAAAHAKLQEKLRSADGREGAFLEREELRRLVVGSASPSVPFGTEAEQFRLAAKIRAEALTARRDELAGTLRSALLARASAAGRTPLRESETFAREIAEEINLDDLRVLDVRWGEPRARLSLHVETTVVPSLDLDQLKRKLRGRSPADAEAFLRAIPGIRSATVTLSPVWVKQVPGNHRNVHITRETPGE